MLVKLLIYPLVGIYKKISQLRNFAFDHKWLTTKRLPGVTISIGNVVMGGSGKTPLVITMAKKLQKQGFLPAILTKGYKSGLPNKGWAVILSKKIVAGKYIPKQFHPDEALMQSAAMPNIPIIVGSYRYKAAQKFLQKYDANCWILDDGLQHRQIHRDLNFVLIDTQTQLSTQKILNRQPILREPLLPALARADLLVFTRFNENLRPECNKLSQKVLKPATMVSMTTTWPRHYLNKEPLCHGPVLVICGIAKPKRFILELKSLGVNIQHTLSVADHSPISFKKIKYYGKNCVAIVTTAKDFYRHSQLFPKLNIPTFISSLHVKCIDTGIDTALSKLLVR